MSGGRVTRRRNIFLLSPNSFLVHLPSGPLPWMAILLNLDIGLLGIIKYYMSMRRAIIKYSSHNIL